MEDEIAPEELDAFLEGVRQSLIESHGFLDVDAMLGLLDMTMEEFEVVAQQENFPAAEIIAPGWALWDLADVVKWRDC
ncbi:MAG TPA: hypothetical protein VFI59_11950 [Actinomycetota bacterium]|nr:hypothetical protein [Actinomycetota bacterium]